MNNPPLTYTIKDAVKATGLSRSSFYNLINSGRLPRLKVGKRVLLRAADIQQLLDNCQQVRVDD